MQIKTKFELGQTVFTVKEGKIVIVTVSNCTLHLDINGKVDESYVTSPDSAGQELYGTIGEALAQFIPEGYTSEETVKVVNPYYEKTETRSRKKKEGVKGPEDSFRGPSEEAPAQVQEPAPAQEAEQKPGEEAPAGDDDLQGVFSEGENEGGEDNGPGLF